MKNILALDLGTNTGYCYNVGPQIYSGTWLLASKDDLKTARKARFDRRCDIRVPELYRRLDRIVSSAMFFDYVIFEDVRFHTSLAQSQLWSSLRTAVWLSFAPCTIEAVDVGTLKKFATGSGAADKLKMRAYLKGIPALFKEEMDDNAVDAAWLFLWAKTNLAKEKI